MRRSFCAAMAVVLSASLSTAVMAEEKWQNLLPNNRLDAHWSTSGNWKINDDGVVSLKPRPGESGWTRYDAYLWHEKTYDDFEIEFDYKVEEKGNSGFYFNVVDKTNPVAEGIEVQIYDSHDQAKLTDHTSGGVIPGVSPQKNAANPAGQWNTFHITVRGEKLTVKLNGQVVNEVDLEQGRLADRPRSGMIGFQDHGLPLSLRNIRIRRL
ncbi:3-keto-disaccharide hydrolase [Rubinisphaera brasiliensis]|uniref:3-keto-alpha-glucoside-1,2-lyase/3-keto-2-hydroxy-glucal hydratase domain-containing protein n=1 Tax=Rubinisphaera brasiliensis (strain ATCC 49424 / DSM 5305 / JCM 21570 / IAM 15109 / NBRC 103401 / IFAM 1448) TaxID=756272 RepID=F0SFN2_RUBBR|nr:DUF1080 domain-containing protein [Rubinisphaera brasiliensis]ADY60492.1 protein of unknown function DUF1080 [Rubinisphaera brasiliensis DSM 5305]